MLDRSKITDKQYAVPAICFFFYMISWCFSAVALIVRDTNERCLLVATNLSVIYVTILNGVLL